MFSLLANNVKRQGSETVCLNGLRSQCDSEQIISFHQTLFNIEANGSESMSEIISVHCADICCYVLVQIGHVTFYLLLAAALVCPATDPDGVQR